MSCPTVRLCDVTHRPRYIASCERIIHTKFHWIAEMVAETLGVFFYVYAGVGATAAFVVGTLTAQQIGSLFTIGVAYAIGIVLALAICAATSGGHFNPAVTVSFVIFRGFPVRKAIMYIFAQIFGAYLACLLIYVQWKDLITIAEGVLVEKGLYDAMMFTPDGPGGIFGLYVLPGTNLHRTLLNEFMTDVLLGLAICACLDPTNHMVPPAAAPWVIGFTYGMAVWGYSPTAISANSARDVGGRLMAMSIWGLQAAGGPYAAIAALTNIPATLLAFLIYDTCLTSSSKVLTPQHVVFLRAHKFYHEDLGLVPMGYLSALEPNNDANSFRTIDEKPMNNAIIETVPITV